MIDAACLRRSERATFAELGRRLGVPTHLVALDAPGDVFRERILARARADSDPSEADLGVLDLQTVGVEPLSDSERANAFVVRTDQVDMAQLARRLMEPPAAPRCPAKPPRAVAALPAGSLAVSVRAS